MCLIQAHEFETAYHQIIKIKLNSFLDIQSKSEFTENLIIWKIKSY